MSTKFQTQFKELKKISGHIRPREEWVLSNKQKLFRQIENSTAFEKKEMGLVTFLEYWMPRSRFMAPLRVALVVVLIFGMTVGSWIAGVSASTDSLPGEVLYKVKIATENTQLALTSALSGNNKAENTAKLQLEFAGRRSQEVKKLVAQQTPEANVHVPETIHKLQETMQNAQDNLKDVKKGDNESVLSLAQSVTKKTSAIAQDLKDVTDQTPIPSVESADIVKQVVAASKIVNDTGLQAIEVVLQDKTVVETSNTEQIKDLVKEKVDILVKNIEDSKVAVEEVKQLSAVVTSTVEFQTNLNVTSSLLIDLKQPATTSLKVIPTAEVKKVGENIIQADKVVGEVKELLQGNQVKEAIEKAKTLNTLTTETQQVLVDSKVKVNAALPTGVVPTIASSTVK